jgi:hypothetical protein
MMRQASFVGARCHVLSCGLSAVLNHHPQPWHVHSKSTPRTSRISCKDILVVNLEFVSYYLINNIL